MQEAAYDVFKSLHKFQQLNREDRPNMNVMESTCSSESRITVESDYIGGLSCEKITRTHSLPGSLDRARETASSSSDMKVCRAATCKTVVELAGENRKERLLERHRSTFRALSLRRRQRREMGSVQRVVRCTTYKSSRRVTNATLIDIMVCGRVT